MQPLCHLDGAILPLEEARIHPLDRGFLFGDALYEMVKVVGGRPLLLRPHLERLGRGLVEVAIPRPEGLEEAAAELLAASGLEQGGLYFQVTRGVSPRTHIPADGMRPTALIVPMEIRVAPPAGRRLRAVTVPDWRWRRCDLKSTSLMGTVLGKLEARRGGADEVIFLGPEDELREGGSVSLFVRRGERLETAPLNGSILPSVTRQILLDLAAAEGLPVVERTPRLGERGEWRELIACGTMTGVQPVVELDGETVGDGETGPWTRRLARLHAEHEEELAGEGGG